jgi:hypothetical protein
MTMSRMYATAVTASSTDTLQSGQLEGQLPVQSTIHDSSSSSSRNVRLVLGTTIVRLLDHQHSSASCLSEQTRYSTTSKADPAVA